MEHTAQVLVVDDNPEDVQFLSGILQSAGYGTRSASTVKAGLAMAAAERCEVIILDHRFNNPAAVGISAVYEFSQRATAGVIMLTAFGDEDVEKDAKLLGAAAYLTKPVDSETLLRTVKQVIDKPRTVSPET
jgi:DNA-binding NtrC family response regulator